MADRRERNVRFETISSEIKEFGQNNFIEISRNKAISDDGENEFITIARGYFRINYETNEPEKVYKKSVTVPDISEMKEFIKEQIGTI
ncbi:MAG: hypothetical protein KAU14_00815 [Thermoplasmata archaeon]|nr:hypothetical protein [Thermoplasmata archaeon]